MVTMSDGAGVAGPHFSRYDEFMGELESEGAAEWTDHEAASFQRDVEAAYLAGELTRDQYSYLIRES